MQGEGLTGTSTKERGNVCHGETNPMLGTSNTLASEKGINIHPYTGLKGVPSSTAKDKNAHQVGSMTQKKEQETIIDLDTYTPSKSEWPKCWISDLHLTQADKEILNSPHAWLSDTIINAAQMLLKKGNPIGCWSAEC
jgi:hypothetical protein